MRRWTTILCLGVLPCIACGGSDSKTDPDKDSETGGNASASGGASSSSETSSSVAMGGHSSVGGTSGVVASSGALGLGGATTATSANARQHCKRGVAYGTHSDADLTALSSKVVWWYNWYFAPDSTLSAGKYEALAVEYVPMIWGPGVKLADATSQIPANATTLLGYNEPNFFSQANVSADDTAAAWPMIQAIADAKGLQLVSPAVNYCGGGCHDTDPFNYLKAFFAACTDCRVDKIAVHIYVGCRNMTGNHAQWLIDHLERYQTEFTQPIWLTEFACDDAENVAEQKAFLEDAVAYLEKTPRIERYAWFAGRADNVPFVDLLGDSGELTELGQAYLAAPANADCQP